MLDRKVARGIKCKIAVALEWAGLKDCTQIAFRDISFGLISY